MAIGDSAGILFKIKGDASDAVRAFTETEAAQKGLTGSTAGLTSSFSSLAGPAIAAGAAVAAIGVAAIAGTRALFDLAKSASEFGSEIFDASEKTGLSAERLSAMKFAADQSGTSLDQVTAGAARFSKAIGDAGNGSKEAQAKLVRLGVTSTDLDTALKQALTTIAKTDSGTRQMALAMDAFGKSGADLLPFIKSFDGDLDGLTEKAKELGVTLTDEDAAAADRFGDQLDTLNAQFAGITRTIGLAFMPVFNDMARSLSDFFTRNHEAIQQFATGTSDILRGFIVTLQKVDQQTQETTNSSLAAWASWAIKMRITLDPITNVFARLLQYMKGVGAESRGVTALLGSQLGSRFDAPASIPRVGSGGGGGRSRVDTSARDAAQLASRDLSAQIKIETGNLRTVQEQLSDAFDKIKNDLLGSDVKTVQATLVNFTKEWVENLQLSLNHLDELEKEQLKVDATENERAALRQQQEERRHKIRLGFAKEIKDTSDALFKEQVEQAAFLADVAQAEFNAEMNRAEERKKQFEKDAGFGNIPELSAAPLLNPDVDTPGPFDAWTASWDEFFTRFSEEVGIVTDLGQTFGNVMADVGGMLEGAFLNIARAVGNVIQQWVLYGKTGPAVMRQILASALATVAAEAAVKAIMATAEGFYFLATHQYASAANAFTAAGFYAAVAGVAAIAGRAVAGNSFNQQTGQSAGAGNRSSSSSSRGGGQGEAYSGQSDQILGGGRNQPAQVSLTVHVDGDNFLAKALKFDVDNNGPTRGIIKGVAEG